MRRTLVMSWIGLAALCVLVMISAPPSLGIGVQSAEMCASLSGLPSYDQLEQADGRINQVAHFGGDAIYCTNSALNPTNDLSVMLNGGDFRVLDIHGQPLWTVPADQIAAAIAQQQASGQGVEVGTGNGSYGPVSLWVIGTDESGNPLFQFNGVDEHGKSNSLEFNRCTPVNPIPSPGTHTSPEPALCSIYLHCGLYEDLPCSDSQCDIRLQDIYDVNSNGRTDDYICSPS